MATIAAMMPSLDVWNSVGGTAITQPAARARRLSGGKGRGGGVRGGQAGTRTGTWGEALGVGTHQW